MNVHEIAAVGDLELVARAVVDGVFSGAHRSLRRGAGAEFQQHRSYHPGDDLKHLDWKLLARTDRLHTRQYREATGMSVMLVLDSSGSMQFPDEGVSKLRYSAILAAALAYIVTTQGDAVGLMTRTGGELDYLPARSGRVHFRSVVGRLERIAAGGTWDAARTLERGAELLGRRGIVVAISDFYDDEEGTRAALRRIARRGHDTAMLQVLSDPELALPRDGEVELVDAETGRRQLIDARAAANEHDAAMRTFVERCRDGAARDGVDYALARTSLDAAAVLRAFLLRRSGRGSAGAAAAGLR